MTARSGAHSAATEQDRGSPLAAAGLGKRALLGSAWALGGHVGREIIRLGSNLLLTRLLFPAVFGQMALIQVFVMGLGLFSDIGTGPAIVQSKEGDNPRFLHTIWTMQIIRGLALWAGTFAVAWPAAAFYGQPDLRWLIPASGFSCVLQGLESTAQHTATRHLKLGRLTLVDLTAQLAGTGAIVALVLVRRSAGGPDDPSAVWAVVAGNLLGAAVRTLLTHVALQGIRQRLLWDPFHARRQLAFGRWVFLSTALAFLAAQLDRLIFGRAIPMELLGVYGIALMASSIPGAVVLKLGDAVVFPAFAQIAGQESFGRRFAGVRALFLVGGAVLVSGLIASGPPLIRLIYDSRYAGAGWILPFLAVMSWFQILGSTNEAAMMALGRPHWIATGNGVKVALLVLFLPAGLHLFGFSGALCGLVFAELGKYAVSAFAAARRGLGAMGRDLAMSGLIAATALAGTGVARTASRSAHPDLYGFLGAGTLVVMLWAAIVLAGWRAGHATESLELLRRR